MASDWYQKKQGEYIKSDVVTTNLMNHEYSIGKNTAINKFKSDYQYSFSDWGKNQIIERQKVLMDLAIETWRFNGQRIDKQIIEEANEQ